MCTLRPRLLLSFSGSMILRCLSGNGLDFPSSSLDETENISMQFSKNSSLNIRFVHPFSGTFTAHRIKDASYSRIRNYNDREGKKKNPQEPKHVPRLQGEMKRLQQCETQTISILLTHIAYLQYREVMTCKPVLSS